MYPLCNRPPPPQFLNELLPARYRHLFEDDGSPNLAFEYVESLVCAEALRFVGNLLTPYSAAVCHERAQLNREVASGQRAGPELEVPVCTDVYNRDSKAGL